MNYRGPESGEFADVEALNYAYLDHLRRTPGRAAALSRELGERLAALAAVERTRLAQAPFLLFSLHEDDAAYWGRLLAGRTSGDLFGNSPKRSAEATRIAAAALAYVWQLSRQDPHLARLVSGASPQWCEMLAARPLVELLDRCTARDDLLELRRGDDHDFWRRLLGAGTSEVDALRNAAHISALQVVLTRTARKAARRFEAAACRFPAVATRIGEPPESA